MKHYDEKAIRQWLEDNFRLWNARDRDGFMALYKEASPNGLIIEYVGQADVDDGWAACNYMWDNYNQDVTAIPQVMLANGNEGVVHVHNVSHRDGVAHPSVEIYKFENGTLHIRYFHHTDALV